MKVLICTSYKMTNQYVELLADAYQQAGVEVVFGAENFLYANFKPDFVHIQWPEAIYKWRVALPKTKESINLIRSRLLWYRERKIPIIYTMHNILPHDLVSDHENQIFKTIAENADVVVHHGKESINI
ncbi:MAG: hypothetical protein EOM11_10970, partial [Erysipelotrichia bacterium]|nr:hypothetical protein [Erysipelotrichia bacterium]